MKREDVSKIFENATDEQINAILDINSADIGKAKFKSEAERDNYKSQLETAQTALVKLTSDNETEDEAAAITIYLKRDTNVETERQTLSRSTDISVDKFYTVALSNQSKVVLAKFKK